MDFSKVKQIKIKEGIVTKIRHVASDTILWMSKIIALVTGKFPLTLEKSTGEELVDYKIYGESVQDTEIELYNPDLWQDGFIDSSGSGEPYKNSTYPKSKYFKLALKQGQVVQFMVESNDAPGGRVRYIDPETNTAKGTITTGTNKEYVISTGPENGSFKPATFTALKDVTLAFLEISGNISLYTNFSLITGVSPSNPIEIESVGDKQIFPDGYTQLEYIEATGTQYIDTGYKANINTTKFIGSFLFKNIAKTQGILGSRNLTKLSVESCNVFVTSPGNFRFDWVSGTQDELIISPDIKYEIEVTAGYRKVNGVEKRTSYTSDKPMQDNNFYVGNFSNAGSGGFSTGAIGYIYECSLYDDNILVRNLIPAKRNSDNEVGMYDLVSNTFFTNAGTGTFKAGDVVGQVIYKVPVKSTNIKEYKATDFDIEGYFKGDGGIVTGNTWLSKKIQVSGANRIKFAYSGVEVSTGAYIVYWDTDDTDTKGIVLGNFKQLTPTDGFDIPSDAKWIGVSVRNNVAQLQASWELYTDKVTNIYLDSPLRKIDDYADYVDFENKKVVRKVEVVDDTGTKTIEESLRGLDTPTEESIELPSILTQQGTNIISIDTKIQPSNGEIKYYKE